jgi:hypothetical protein
LRADKKYEPETANLKFITASETVIVYAFAVYIRAVQTSHIADTPALGSAANFSMSATDRDVIKK